MNRTAFALVLLVALVARAEDIQGLVVPFKQVSVASPVLQEVVDSVLVEEGDTVTEGQVIVQLRAEREGLQVEQDKKLVEQREFSAKGAAALLKEKMMSREAVLEKETEMEMAKIKLRASEYSFREKTIRSPLNGIVVKKYKEAGESVDRVEKLVDIVSIDQVFVQFYLDPKLLTSVKVEQVVPVRFPVIGEQKFDAKISFVDPRIDAGSGLFRVKLLVENPGHVIKPGMRGVADFSRLTVAR
ncbi:MAG: efflux RND transporter periplasmic adaptor subunit [Chthoniobacteraceae bacterium]